jgi:phage terminase small subunit
LSVPKLAQGAARLKPPADLTREEQELFRHMVGVCAPDHFVESDVPLLVNYCQATLLCRRASEKLREDASWINIWDKAGRMQATLATRLRLAPQARTDPKTVARKGAGHKPSAYDLMGGE